MLKIINEKILFWMKHCLIYTVHQHFKLSEQEVFMLWKLCFAGLSALWQPEVPSPYMPQELVSHRREMLREPSAICCTQSSTWGHPEPQHQTHSSGAQKKHLLWCLPRAHIAVRWDSHADGKNRSCFSHSFFKQQAAPCGYLCREQKKNCFVILMDKGILEQRPYNS